MNSLLIKKTTRKYKMFKKALINLLILTSPLAMSDVGTSTEALSEAWSLMRESDKSRMMTNAQSSWRVLDPAPSDMGLTRVRATYIRGIVNVQQIDYMIDCSNHMMSLADFAVINVTGSKPVARSLTAVENLWFYRALSEHDSKLVHDVCGNKQAGVK